MLSKSQINFIKSLHLKKHRKEHGLFLVEGLKSLTEFLDSEYNIQAIYCLDTEIPKLPKISQKQKVFEITKQELEKISALQAPQEAIAIVEIPKYDLSVLNFEKKLTIVLDGLQDPGNLGTIIRTADWYGFSEIICSNNTVEVYNPKVVQATMGSLSRIKVYYTNLSEFLSGQKTPKYGTLLHGENIYKAEWPDTGFLILGSEGNGISDEIVKIIDYPITIPGAGNTESLNVAIAAAICCSEIKRNSYK